MTTDVQNQNLSFKQKLWGHIDGQPVWLFTLSCGNSLVMNVTNYGAIVQSLKIQHAHAMVDVVLGYDTLSEYVNDPYYLGCVVGRYANRIDGGLITIDGRDYPITMSPGGYHHHGGKKGFGKQVWSAEPFSKSDSVGIALVYTSKHMEEGFPGNLRVRVCYEINSYNQWSISYEATTDQATVFNLTQHTYFNLEGHDSQRDILDHSLETNAAYILHTNDRQNSYRIVYRNRKYCFRLLILQNNRAGYQ